VGKTGRRCNYGGHCLGQQTRGQLVLTRILKLSEKGMNYFEWSSLPQEQTLEEWTEHTCDVEKKGHYRNTMGEGNEKSIGKKGEGRRDQAIKTQNINPGFSKKTERSRRKKVAYLENFLKNFVERKKKKNLVTQRVGTTKRTDLGEFGNGLTKNGGPPNGPWTGGGGSDFNTVWTECQDKL